MPRFVVLYHAPESAVAQMAEVTPEEMEKGMETWMAWAAKCGDALVDLGAPLGNGTKLDSSGSSAFGSTVSGFSILEADSLDDALSLLDGHPHLGWAEGCEIEVHEAMPMPGM